MSKKLTSVDVIKNFYIAQELLPVVFKKKHTEKTLRKALEALIKKADKLPDRFFLRFRFAGHNPRYDHYLNARWEEKTISIADSGTWPRMGGLSDKATSGNTLETALYVKKLLSKKGKHTKEQKEAHYIASMIPYVKIINEYLPIIVLKDGVIRNELLIPEKQRKQYARCLYDIDDGNHRAIALALQGEKKIKAFVGKRVYKNPLLYL